MKEVKLFNLLSSISRKELNELENFVTSKIFNRNKSLFKFYGYISENFEKFKGDNVLKYNIFKYVFTMRNIMRRNTGN